MDLVDEGAVLVLVEDDVAGDDVVVVLLVAVVDEVGAVVVVLVLVVLVPVVAEVVVLVLVELVELVGAAVVLLDDVDVVGGVLDDDAPEPISTPTKFHRPRVGALVPNFNDVSTRWAAERCIHMVSPLEVFTSRSRLWPGNRVRDSA